MSADFVAIIERAYAAEPEEHAWLQGIADAALPVLDAGSGVSAHTFDASDAENLVLGRPAGAGNVPEKWLSLALKSSPVLEPRLVRRAYMPSPPAVLLSETMGRRVMTASPVAAVLNELGMRDVIGIRGADASGRGCMISVPLTAPTPLAPRRRALLARIAAHLGAAYRLRRARAAFLNNADAVLGPRGELEHGSRAIVTSKAARRSLVDATERIQHARSRKLGTEEAVELWRALVAGRWSIVEHVDSDGKRFLLAHSNEMMVHDPAALAPRERQVAALASLGHSNKLIGYELGLAPATVSAHLGRALRKLRVRDRAELVRLFER